MLEINLNQNFENPKTFNRKTQIKTKCFEPELISEL